MEEVSAAVKPFEDKYSSEGTSGVLLEDATSLSEKVVEIQAAAKSKLDAIQKLLLARQKDSEKAEGETEIMQSVDARLKKASAELARSSKVVAESTQVVTARKVPAEAKASAKALEVEVATTTSACAPLAVDGGKKFLVVASADMVVDAFQQVMGTDALLVDELFQQVSDGKPKMSSDSSVEFVSWVPDRRGRQDLRLEESSILAVYKMVDVAESDGISVDMSKALFLTRQYQVSKQIALTDHSCLSHGKTPFKLETEELVEVIGETKRDDRTFTSAPSPSPIYCCSTLRGGSTGIVLGYDHSADPLGRSVGSSFASSPFGRPPGRSVGSSIGASPFGRPPGRSVGCART